jgi:potassium-transporting ATPase KdpC subunit
MKTHLLPALKLTLICIFFFAGVYTLVIWGIGQVVAPNHGKGEIINYGDVKDNSKYGFANIGQSFTADKYFWSRPSSVGYNAAGSGASNKGPTNADYLAQVQARIDTFIMHNPTVKKSDIPVEMVTASGSGLDPDISVQGARIQVPRIAKIRSISEKGIYDLIDKIKEGPLLGFLGPGKRVNVLKLNIALNQIK